MTTSPRFFLLILVILAGCSPDTGPDFRSVLWYNAPATDWSSEALPVGNGRLGAMVFGDPYMERIQLNEDSMWPGGPDWGDAQGSRTDLEEVRQMLDAGKHTARFNAADLPSGGYIYRLTTPAGEFTKMMMLMK